MLSEGIPAGHVVTDSDGFAGYVSLVRTADNGRWILANVYVTGVGFEYHNDYGFVTSVSLPVPALIHCHNLDLLASEAEITTVWLWVGWWLGDTELGMPEGGTAGTDPLILSHGSHASWLGFGCSGCDTPGGDGNTNRFHLDTTNSLAGISNVLSETHRYQRGALTEGESCSLLSSYTNGIGALIEQGKGMGDGALANMTNWGGIGTPTIGMPGSEDFVVGSTGLLGFLETAAASLDVVVDAFRWFLSLTMCWHLGRTVREELVEYAKDAVSIPQTPSKGGSIPLVDLLISKAVGFLIVSAIFAVIPLFLGMMADRTVFVLSSSEELEVALTGPASAGMSRFSTDVPGFVRSWALIVIYVPTGTAIGCAVTYAAFRALKDRVFMWAIAWTKMM